MKKLILLFSIILSGCCTTQLVPQIQPIDVPAQFMVPPKPLEELSQPSPTKDQDKNSNSDKQKDSK